MLIAAGGAHASPAAPDRVPDAGPPTSVAQQSVEVASRCIDAYNRRDLARLRSLSHPNLELDWTSSRWLAAGLYRGIDAVLGFYADWFATFDEVTLEPGHPRVAGNTVLVPNTARLRGRDGIEVVARSTLAFTVVGGRVGRIRLYQAPL
jgi:ketosteroid isomerase-like protein